MIIEKSKWGHSATLDCKGQLCPVPIIMTEERIEKLKRGDVLQVAYTDRGAKPDLLAWGKVTGHEILGFEEKSTASFAYIRKS